MKLNLKLVTGILMMFTLFSCSSTKFKVHKASLSLDGNPTTGYSWYYSIEDESIVSVDEKVTYLGKNNMVGAPSRFDYTFKSLKAGTTTVKFEYKRIWENVEPAESHTYNIEVNENGIITISESAL